MPRLASAIPLRGIGLFSGRAASLSIAPGDHGIRFRRAGFSLPLHVSHIFTDTTWTGLPRGVPVRNTTLGSPQGVFATVEHLAAACAGLGLWATDITFDDGPEVPILDGSALPFVRAIEPALRESPPPEPLVLGAPVEVRQGDSYIRAEPHPGIEYTYSLDYGPASPLKPHQATWHGDPSDFVANVAPARTFSLAAEARAAQAAGLFKHLSPREMLVVGDDGAPIDNAWRLPDEPARHKLLDLIGDLALLGRPLRARVLAHRSGHALTHEFCRRVLDG